MQREQQSLNEVQGYPGQQPRGAGRREKIPCQLPDSFHIDKERCSRPSPSLGPGSPTFSVPITHPLAGIGIAALGLGPEQALESRGELDCKAGEGWEAVAKG